MILYFLFAGVAGNITTVLWDYNTLILGAPGDIFKLIELLLAFNIFKIIP
jgi:hypothetical protein